MGDFYACAQAMHKEEQRQNSASHVDAQICNLANFPCKPNVCSSSGSRPVCDSDYTEEVLKSLAHTDFCMSVGVAC